MPVALRRPPLFATRRSRTVAFGVAVAGAAAGGALLSAARPTGIAAADAFWSAVLVAVLATFGATARRWTWFLPAGVAAALAGDGLAVAVAAAAIAVAFVSVVRDTRSRARGALVAALGGIALLRADPAGFHGATAILTAAAIVPPLVSGYTHAGRRVQARTRRVALVAGGTVGLMLVGAALGLVSVQRDLADGIQAVDRGMAAARAADDVQAAEQLSSAARALGNADGTLSSWFVSPAKSLPLVGPNLDAVGSLAAQAGEVAKVTALAADDADVDALRLVDGRLDPQAVADLHGPLTQVRRAIQTLDAEVDEARSPWLLAAVANRIDVLDDRIDEALPEAELAVDAVAAAPHLLGVERPQRYLVLFTTPVEARGRTGFPGNYAELVVDDGKLSMPVFGRIADLERAGLGTGRTLTQPPELVARYSRFGIADTWRNLTMTPDFVSLAIAVGELYPQSGGRPIDGVLSVDPAGLAAIMRFTGPVEVPGRAPLTAETAERFLLFDQYVEFETDNEQRLQLLDDIARTTFDRLTSADLPGPRVLSNELDPLVDGGHIQFTTLSLDALGVLNDVGVTGWFRPPDEGVDTVSVTTANAGGSKIDLFLKRTERYDVRWDPATGEVTGTIEVTLDNLAPVEGWPDYVVGNAVGLPRGTNRSFVSIYSPLQLEEARIGGEPAAVQSEVEAGRNVYSTFVDIPPGGSATIALDLSGTLDTRRYRLELPVQPFVIPDEITVELEVAGGRPVLDGRRATVEGNVARWSATLDRERSLSVSAAPD